MNFLKRLITIILICSALFVATLFGVGYYLNLHKDEVISQFESWYNQYHNGELVFEDVSVSAFKNFPSVALTVKNVVLIDSLFYKHKKETLVIEEVNLLVSLSKLIQREIQFKAFKIKNGTFNIITTKSGLSNKSVFKPLNKNKLSKTTTTRSIKFSPNNTRLIIDNLAFNIDDVKENKRIRGLIKQLKTKLSINESTIKSTMAITLLMHEMGFDLKKGAFFNNTTLKGKLKPIYHKATEQLEIPSFNFSIASQPFKIKANINLSDKKEFDFELESPETNFDKTVGLLPNNIKEKLKKVHVDKPIYTKTVLSGTFHNKTPLIKIGCYTHKNTVTIGNTKIRKATFKGSFLNKLTNHDSISNKSKKVFQLNFKELKGEFNTIPFVAKKAHLYGVGKSKLLATIVIDANGKVKALNEIFNNENFLFQKGSFNLSTSFKGSIKSKKQVLNNLTTNIAFNKSEVFIKPINTKLPLDTLNVSVKNNDASLNILSIPIKKTKSELSFTGNVYNLTALVFNTNKQVNSNIKIESDKLVWEDFLQLFGTVRKKDNKTKIKTYDAFNKAIKEVYTKFNPKLTVFIDSFKYDNLNVTNLKTGVYFKSGSNLRLEETGFNYKAGKVAMLAKFDIKQNLQSLFELDINADNVNAGAFLREFDYFNLNTLQNIESLDGNLTLKANVAGVINGDNGLDDKTLKGKIAFTIKDLKLKGFEPIQKIGNKIFRKKRFEDIHFAPITNTLTVKNRTIFIPQTEIQSTAFNLFVEGKLSYDNATNIWVSVPLKNLKSRDLNNIPNKEGYVESGKKVYISIKDLDDGKLDYKLHLNNKKLYEEQGNLNLYKVIKNEERNERKDYKQEQRQYKKEDRKEMRQLKKELRKQKRKSKRNSK